MNDKLSDSSFELVVLLWSELDWCLGEKLIALSLDFLSIQLFLSSQSLLFFSDDLLILLYLSSKAFKLILSVFNDLVSVSLELLFEFLESSFKVILMLN